MNTVCFKSITEAAGNYLIYSAGTESDFDRIAVKMLASDLPSFLAPVKIMNMYDECIVKYETGRYKNIASLKMRMSKNECCTLIYNLIYPMIVCGEWFLDYHKFFLQKDYILCDSETFDIRYIYMLDKNFYNSDVDIMNVFRDIFKNTDIIDDKDFKINLLQILLGDGFSINSLYEMIIDIRKSRKEPPKNITAPSANPNRVNNGSKFLKDENKNVLLEKHILKKTVESPDISFDDESDDIVGLFTPKEKNKPKTNIFSGLFGKNKASGKTVSVSETAKNEENDYTVITGVNDETDYDKTCILRAFLNLESSEIGNCPASIPIMIENDESVTIGRKSSNPGIVNADIEFPSDCTKISRKHCRVRFENGVYSICDLNSGNGTFVDGQKVENGIWMDLHNGSTLVFGDKAAVYSFKINE